VLRRRGRPRIWLERLWLTQTVLGTDPRELTFNVVDLETTGLDPVRDRVLEVAVVQITGDGTILGEYTSLVAADRVECTAIHGLTAGDLAGAPTFSEIAGDLAGRLDGGIVAGHNVGFDVAFLLAEFDRAHVPVSAPSSLCTMLLGRRIGLERRRANLGRACARMGIAITARHSALGDARATAALLAAYLAHARSSGRRPRWRRRRSFEALRAQP
jgi:DNA polymerase III epsilon subunit family exonuclease